MYAMPETVRDVKLQSFAVGNRFRSVAAGSDVPLAFFPARTSDHPVVPFPVLYVKTILF